MNLTTNITATQEDAMLAIRDSAARGNPLRMRGTSKGLAEKMDSTAHEFESQFIAQMMGTMFSTVEPNEELGGGESEEYYQSMLSDEYGKVLARTGGIGVADQVKQIMIRQQEVGIVGR